MYFLYFSFLPVAHQDATLSSEPENNDEQEQIRIARALLNYRLKEKMGMANSTGAPVLIQNKFPVPYQRPSSPQPPPVTTSKILPLIRQKSSPRNRPTSSTPNDSPSLPSQRQVPEVHIRRSQNFPGAGAAPYVPYRHFRTPYHGIAQPVTMRTAVPVYSAPPLPPPSVLPPQMMQPQSVQIAPPICIRQAVATFTAPPVQKEDPLTFTVPILPNKLVGHSTEETGSKTGNDLHNSEVVKSLEELKI